MRLIVLSTLKWLTLQPLQIAKAWQMPAPADRTFLAWDREKRWGLCTHPPPKSFFFFPVNAWFFWLELSKHAGLVGLLSGLGFEHGIGPMTKATPKRMKDPNKSEPVQNDVLSGQEEMGLGVGFFREFSEHRAVKNEMDSCLYKNSLKIDSVGIRLLISPPLQNSRNVIHSMLAKSANHDHMTLLCILWHQIHLELWEAHKNIPSTAASA